MPVLTRFCIGLFFLAAVIVLRGASAPIDWPELAATQVATGATFPVHVAHSGDGSGRLFVVEQPGRILVTTSNGFATAPFLDIRDRVHFEFGADDGLLNLVFATNYAATGQFYVYYTRTGDFASVISRFTVSANSNLADTNSEEPILVIPEITAGTLNGGMLAFGPAGYLYIGTGDNGYFFNLESLAQNPATLWGKILRIDVNGVPHGYAIPPGNPFVGQPGRAPEIWALGLRNPWRFSFDRANGDLYISDVGQFIAEEIDYSPAPGASGRNYGWQVREGRHEFFVPPDRPTGMTDPIFEVVHDPLTKPYSITGGCVYRGAGRPRMDGKYFFGDFYSGKIQALVRSNGTWHAASVLQTSFFLSSFGEDEAGMLYVTDYISGSLHRLDDSTRTRAPAFDPPGPTNGIDSVTITSLSPGAVIHYTTNGIDPDELAPAVVSGDTVLITSGTTLKARAYRTNQQPSAITSVTYFFKAAKPLFTPSRGPLTNNTAIAITSATPASVIRYTLNGTDPDATSPVYSAPVIFSTNQMLKARAFRTDFADSDVTLFHSAPLHVEKVFLPFMDVPAVMWTSMTGQTYRVQYSPDLSFWINVGSSFTGTGATMGFTNLGVVPNPRRGFYPVLAQ